MPRVASAPPLNIARRQARRLAALHGATPDAMIQAISLWPLGARLCLSAHDLIAFQYGHERHSLSNEEIHEDVHAAADRGEPVDFSLTERGLEVIEECAEWRWQEEPEEAEGDEPTDTELSDGADWPQSLATSDELEKLDEAVEVAQPAC